MQQDDSGVWCYLSMPSVRMESWEHSGKRWCNGSSTMVIIRSWEASSSNGHSASSLKWGQTQVLFHMWTYLRSTLSLINAELRKHKLTGIFKTLLYHCPTLVMLSEYLWEITTQPPRHLCFLPSLKDHHHVRIKKVWECAQKWLAECLANVQLLTLLFYRIERDMYHFLPSKKIMCLIPWEWNLLCCLGCGGRWLFLRKGGLLIRDIANFSMCCVN